MKKYLLMIALFAFSIGIMAQGAVAVNDTASILLGQKITLNVLENDYHPEGLTFKILDAYGADSYTDSTITYYADYYLFYNVEGEVNYDYTLIDENGNLSEESIGDVILEVQNHGFSDYLDVNNIRARINSWGNNFWRGVDNLNIFPEDDTTFYEYINGSRKNTIFSQSLWIGGKADGTQLKLAAERYRQIGMDFWTGPVSVVGSEVSIEQSTVIEWNRVWRLSVEEILEHKHSWNDPGYEPIEAIATWPAHGDPDLNQSEYLAPFIDMDGDDTYDPLKGDYPLIRGDQCIYFINNDVRLHTESEGEQIGVEIHGMAYEFDNPTSDPMHSTLFLSYKIFNKSASTLNDSYIGLFCDFDLGYAGDDFVGCDVSRGAFYGYNGKEIDGFGEDNSYGANPPAQGIVILGGPYMDPNGEDDPSGGCDESINGVGFGDGIADNERYGMKKFLYFNNTLGIQGDPEIAIEYYNCLKGIWRDGTAMEYGGNGHVSSGAYGPAADFMFPGLSDECYWGTGGEEPYGPVNWTEEAAGNEPDDRRGLSVMGPFTFLAGSMHKVDLAFVTARGDNGPQSSVELLKEYIDEVKGEYYKDTDYFGYQWLGTEDKINIKRNVLHAYPNPAKSEIWIDYESDGRVISYTIHDIYGREIIRKQVRSDGTFTISVDGLKKGLYIVSLVDGTDIFTTKVMKE